jgi:hypothetical protein
MRRVSRASLIAWPALFLAVTGGAYALSVPRADDAGPGAAAHRPPRLTAPGW